LEIVAATKNASQANVPTIIWLIVRRYIDYGTGCDGRWRRRDVRHSETWLVKTGVPGVLS